MQWAIAVSLLARTMLELVSSPHEAGCSMCHVNSFSGNASRFKTKKNP